MVPENAMNAPGRETGDMRDTVWFFAYGSLMWNPGFEHDAVVEATLHGHHRALCIYSWVWRGTREKPGLVLGLAEGGSCRAQAIGVRREREAEVLAILDARELVTGVYHRKHLPLELADGGTIEAWCYLARSDHEQFAGDLEAVDALRLIRQGHGRGGDNSEYVLNTAEHLRILGIRDERLELLTMHLAADRNARIR